MTDKVPEGPGFLSPDLPSAGADHVESLRKARVVLVEPRHPGNIGSVARAMKVCAFSRLHLVNPVAGWRTSDDAWMFACGSRDVLEGAVECETLEEALAGVVTVIGTTHRIGRGRGPLLPPRKLAEHLPGMLEKGEIALVFGREDKGLSNEELARCQMGVHIPTAGTYPSLNLSHAVMVIAYECFCSVVTNATENADVSLPSYPETSALAERMASLLEETGFVHRRGRVGLERSLRQGLHRSNMTTRDIALAHLVCRQIGQYIQKLDKGPGGPQGD